jgi:methylaspartate mutase epsilon subunit
MFCGQGEPCPQNIFAALMAAGLHATEGGPVSYCLPYSRAPLDSSIRNWIECCEMLAAARGPDVEPHLESFGGCMLGQLCPPELLIAVTVLEGLFFREHGLRNISLSYAQQTNRDQDREALHTLTRLAGELLHGLDWHTVLYTYMGVFPRTPAGASSLLVDSARLAVDGGAARLIVKTTAEAHRIPTIAENITALEQAARTAERHDPDPSPPQDTGMYQSARALIEATLELNPDVGRALRLAFSCGCLDVPYCLHADNRGQARSYIDSDGRLAWATVGAMPLPRPHRPADTPAAKSSDLLTALAYVQRTYDQPALESQAGHPAPRAEEFSQLPPPESGT